MSHPWVPPLIELRCRRCGGLLRLEHPGYKDGRIDTLENYYTVHDSVAEWIAACDGCLFRESGIDYATLPQMGDLFYLTRVGNEELWGWNREHLEMVIAFLEAKDISRNRWRAYSKFIRGRWQIKSRRHAIIKAGKELLG
jgi:hypothetical protein